MDGISTVVHYLLVGRRNMMEMILDKDIVLCVALCIRAFGVDDVACFATATDYF